MAHLGPVFSMGLNGLIGILDLGYEAPALKCLVKSLVSFLPTVRSKGVKVVSILALSGFGTNSFITYFSCEKQLTGGISAIFVPRTCLETRSLSLFWPRRNPIFWTGSFLMLLYLLIWSELFTRVFTKKCLLSTTIFLLKSSICFYFNSAISLTMSSPEINTVLK